jgi:PAS domain S-box-containing protein
MNDKNKDQLIKEVAELRQRISHFKKFEKECTLAMDSLQKSETRYRHFVENSPNPIFSIDEKGIIKSWNRACENTFQYDKSIIGKNYIDLLSTSEDQKLIKPAIKKAFQGQSLSDIFISFKAKDGAELFMVSRLYPLIDNDERIRECVFANTNITEHKKAEIALSESELKYRSLIEEALQVIVIIQDGAIVFANPALSEITGYSNAELLLFKPEQIRALIHPDDQEMVWKRLEDRLAGKDVPSYYAMRAIKKDGTVCWFEMFAKLIDYHGRPAVQAAFIDITDRKKVEEELKKSEIKYRSLVENALAGIAATDLSGKFTFVNKALCNMIGYSEEELTGKSFADFLNPKDRNRILQILRNTIKHPKGGIPIEFRAIHKKGHTIYMYSKATPLIYNNKVIGFNAIITDITEMKQVEEALHESEEKYRTLVEQSLQGISIIQDNRFVFVNPALAEITGYTIDELLTLSPERMEKTIHPDDLELVKKRFEDIAAGHDIIPQYKFRAIRKDGSVRWIDVFSNPITFKGRPARQVAYMDITERKKAEDAMRDSERRLSDIIQYLPDPTCVIDREGIIIAWNNALEELTGVKAEEMLGKGNHEYSLPFYGKRRPVLMDLVLQPNNKEIEKLYPFVKKDRDNLITENYIPSLKGGIYIWVQARPLYDSQGNIVGAISTVRNITEGKQAEEALQKSEQKFRSLADQSLVGIYILKDRRIIYANQGLSDISGYSIDEMLRWEPEGFAQMIHPDEKDFVIEQGRKKQRGEKDVLPQYTYRMITKSGKIRTVETYSKTVPFEDGIAVQGVVIDTTERKEAEEALRESEEKFREIFESASDAIYTVDAFGNFTSGNKMAENITGYCREELIGKHFFTLVIGDDKQKAIESFKHTLNGKHHSFSLKIRRKDEEIRTLSVHAAPLIRNGDIVGSQGIARDISEQLKLERKLKESEERFKGIFENAHDAIMVTNKEGFIILANPRFFELSGFSSQDLNEIHLSQIIHPEDSDYILLYFNRAISGEIGYERLVTRGITKDGSTRYLDINANVMKKDKAIVGIQAIIRDITEGKALEEKLRENYKELIKTIAGFLEIKDLYTEKHSRRIVEDSIYLASKLNMSEEEIKDIEIGALLHDLGKIKIPGKILNKGTKYNKKEEQIMRKHSQLGEEAIKNIPEFYNASKLIRHHHERYDGEGYPDRLKGEEIPLGARIIALIDAFDAMLSDRPYRKALTYKEAKQELIREKGKQFDPYLTNIYLRYLESKFEHN